MTACYSWGRLKPVEALLCAPLSRKFSLTALLKSRPENNSAHGKSVRYLPRGHARSYGDACLLEGGTLVSSLLLDRLIAFDPQGKTITCESGVLLRDLQRFLVPRGFMLPVTPGTELITVGGAIAADVHCKNHHRYGTFGCHVLSFTLHRSDGEILECSPGKNCGYFKATIGGMGLTGFISEATLSLKPVPGPMIGAENIAFENLEEFFALTKESTADFEHTVSWTDCVSGNGQRGIFMRGNHAPLPEPESKKSKSLPLAVPLTPPLSLVNGLSLRAFNLMYYAAQKRHRRAFNVHYEKFFYPLDGVAHWNRIYGPAGFYQYQYVIPPAAAREATAAIQQEISHSGQGSFLGVLKTFGSIKSPGLLSFPMEGVTYALDFPNRGADTEKLFARLDAIVGEAGGRLYLAKDARQPRKLFEQGYGSVLDEFLKYVDPRCSSELSRRLMGS